MFDSWRDYEESSGTGTVATIPELGKPHRLPSGLTEMEPGVDLGSALARINRRRVSGPDQVIVMQAWSRQVAHAQAELYASMVAVAEPEAEVAGPDDDLADIHDLAASEIQAALSWTRRAAEFQLGFAQDLVARYPRVWAALHRGLIDLPRHGSSSTRPLISTRRRPGRSPTSPWSERALRPLASSGRGFRGW